MILQILDCDVTGRSDDDQPDDDDDDDDDDNQYSDEDDDTDDGDGSNDVIESCNCANSAKGSMLATAAAVPAARQLNSNFENLGRAEYWTLVPSTKCPAQYFKLGELGKQPQYCSV